LIPAKVEWHSTFAGIKSDVVAYLERIAEKRPLADVLLISPGGAPGDSGPFTLKNQVRVVGKGQPDGTGWRLAGTSLHWCDHAGA
jgi:hypothetical protein